GSGWLRAVRLCQARLDLSLAAVLSLPRSELASDPPQLKVGRSRRDLAGQRSRTALTSCRPEDRGQPAARLSLSARADWAQRQRAAAPRAPRSERDCLRDRRP